MITKLTGSDIGTGIMLINTRGLNWYIKNHSEKYILLKRKYPRLLKEHEMLKKNFPNLFL